MTKNSKITGHLAAAGAYGIFGFNIIFCKDIANSSLISPMLLFLFRAMGAVILFWIASFFLPKEKVEKKDMLMIALASMLGLFIPQVSFLEAITITTPIDTAILTTLTPIFTMLFSAVFLKEPITGKKVIGVLLSFAGIIFLILNSVHGSNDIVSSSWLGIVLMIVNVISFGLYLGIFRPLISKYSVITFMKWMFLFSFALCLPFAWTPLNNLQFSQISTSLALEIVFVIVFSTFVAYFLIPFGQKKLRPTVVSMYSYLQPIIAAAISIFLGMDTVTWEKIGAVLLVFGGVALVNKSRAATPSQVPSCNQDGKVQ